MFRKVASLAVAIVVTSGVMIAVPADAAVKITNGVACKKSGATTKTSLRTYRCATNPLTTSKKLTWLSLDCVATARDAVKAQKDSVVTSANFKAQIPIIELGITNEIADRTALQTKLDNANLRLPAARVDLEAAKVKLLAAVTVAEKSVATKSVTDLTEAVRNWTAAIRGYGQLIRTKDLSIKNLETAKQTAVNRPIELSSTVKGALANAKLICTKGI